MAEMKTYTIIVRGFDPVTLEAISAGLATAQAWRNYCDWMQILHCSHEIILICIVTARSYG